MGHLAVTTKWRLSISTGVRQMPPGRNTKSPANNTQQRYVRDYLHSSTNSGVKLFE